MKQVIDLKKKNLSITLQEQAKDVTATMKARAELKYGLGRTTINDYLKGEIGNIPTAEALYKFFKKEIIATADIRA